MKVYAKRLNDTRESYKNKINEADSVEDLYDIYQESVGSFMNLIPEFFSSRGEGNNIRAMYQKLRDNQYARFMKESVIDAVDLNFAGSAYKEYLAGMNEFISDICDSCMDGEIYAKESVECKEKLDRAVSNDGDFIDSIFGGSTNPTSSETIMESMQNIEYLISFIDDVKEESDQCGVTIDKIKKGISNHIDSADLLTESTRLMVNSVNDYINHTISVVFESYDKINEILENRGIPKKEVSKGFRVF